MTGLADIILRAEADLVSRVIDYAQRMGYAEYTPTDERVWQISIRGLSDGLVSALRKSPDVPELSPNLTFVNDRITAFGVDQAKKHRARGVTFELYLGLMKYFRQSYHDIIENAGSECTDLYWAHSYVDRYFDRIELGFIAEWERASDAANARHEQLLVDKNQRLSETVSRLNREITERKRAEQQVRKLNLDLERRVESRTLQLKKINEKNHYKLKELLILNRLSSLNLAQLRLDRLSGIILATLVSHPPLFFDRALLFLLNDRTEVLQGMLGIIRNESVSAQGEECEFVSEQGSQWSSPLNQQLRSCRIELHNRKDLLSRTVKERRVFTAADTSSIDEVNRNVFIRLGIRASFATMPLLGKNGVIGVIIVDNPLSGRKVNRDDGRFLKLFSSHAGITVENLMLYGSLEEANRQINEAHAQLVHGERLATIGEMAASIAHELKGPMVAIGGFARRLAKSIPPGTPEAGFIATIIEEEHRLEQLLDEVLSFARKTTLCFQRCSITEIVEGALAIVGHLIEKNRVSLVKVLAPKAFVLHCDRQQLKQVFVNLLQNALDEMKDGGVLKVTVAPSTLAGEPAVAVRISDTGGGIPAELRNNIFNPFFTTKSGGTGLGLPITNRIVLHHKGKLRVRNHSAGGAEFTVILPCIEK